MQNKFTPLSKNGEMPMDRVLCVFKSGDLYILGYIVFEDKKVQIKEFGKYNFYTVSIFTHFMFVPNDKGGYIFIK